MIFDQVENVYTSLAANFASDYATLLTAKSVTSPGTIALVMRQRAEIARKYGIVSPFLGIYCIAARTQAKDQAKRDTEGAIGLDLFIEGTDPELVARQIEVGAEALLLTIDRLPAAAGGVHWAAELPRSITIELNDAYDEGEDSKYWRLATVSFPLRDRDEPL